MLYLGSFGLSDENIGNPNIYQYNVFQKKDIQPFVFEPVTVLYGNNGSGKSTILNIMASVLNLKGKEFSASNQLGITDYVSRFFNECSYSLADDEYGRPVRRIPANSRYVKSEDILYEIKKIQQTEVLADGQVYDLVKHGMTKDEVETYLQTREGSQQLEFRIFAQEKVF